MERNILPGGWKRGADAHRTLPYVILLLSLIATAAGTYITRSANAARDRLRFENLVESAEARNRGRMEMYVALLNATRGLFDAGGRVGRNEFRVFVERLEVQRNYPGVQGIGFSRRMRPEEKSAVTAAVRREWRPGFVIRPEGGRPEYHAIVYLEPQDRRNQVAIGYDMFTEPVRRAAMERARDTGRPAASGLVTLVQEIDRQKQSGFLIYVPVYRRGMPISTVSERRSALLGFAYSPFRVDDLMDGVLSREEDANLSFEIFAGATPIPLLRRSNPGKDGYRSRLRATRLMDVAGVPVSFIYSERPEFHASSTAGQANLIMGAGLTVTILIFLVALSQAKARSVTERVAGELAKSEAAIRETERLKTEFMANVSHELRTPLTLALAPLESLIGGEYGPVLDRQSDALRSIHNNAVRLLQLVNGLLDFSKLEAGKVEVRRSALPLVALTRAILADFRPLARNRGVTLVEGLPDEATVSLDRYLYERIVFNLVSNAIKFTPKGGRVTMDVLWDAGRLRLRVADTGCGIAAGEIPKLFQRFRQVEGSSTRRFEGTGLGLALVREFARLLGGDVSVESEAGRGTVFTVDVEAPAAFDADNEEENAVCRPMIEQYPAPAAPADIRNNGGPDGRLKVLIAEDNDELRNYIAELLAEDYDLRPACDGEEALEAARTWSPDLVLSDVMMPGRDGISLCRELKKGEDTGDIPVVLLTALTHRDSLLKGWEAGADEYLFKPFHPNELRTRVRSLLANALMRKRAERIAAQAQKMASIGQLAAGVAHDFNNILTSLLGSAHLLRASAEVPESCRPDLETIIGEGERAAQLIGQLLDYTRQAPAEMRVTDLAALLEATHGILCRALPANISIAVENAEEPLPVLANASRIQQVLLNLALNARDAMLKGGSLRLSLRRLNRPGDEPAPFDAMNGEWAALAMADDGCGMSLETLGHLFEPFFTTKGLAKGTGLGLAQAYGIVKQHRGHLHVDSAEGKGSTFTIYLPVAAAETAAAPGPRGDENGRGGTVMLVEDEAPVRNLASRILRQAGFNVVEACAAEEAIRLFQAMPSPIDLLVTDVIMPGLNGRQLAERLTLEQPGLKVLYISGYTSGIVGMDGVLDNDEALLRKPFTPDSLVSRVRSAVA